MKRAMYMILFLSLAIATLHAEEGSESDGRKKKSDDSANMAMLGAAVAGGMCIFLMNEARKLPPGTERTMLMMQAAQQCAQSAASAANAGQNKDGSALMTAQPGTMQQLPERSDTTKAPETPKQETSAPTSPTVTSAPPTDIADATTEDMPRGFIPSTPSAEIGGNADTFTVGSPIASSVDMKDPENLNGIQNQMAVPDGQIRFNDLAMNKDGSEKDGKKDADGEDKDHPRRDLASATGSNGIDDSDSDGDSKNNNMLNPFLSAGMNGDAFGGNNEEIITIGADLPKGMKKANIFEFAKYQYSLLNSQGKINPHGSRLAYR